MSNTASTLNQLLAAQGRTVREGQAAAADHIDAGAKHTAAQCPTGVGKSALAVSVSVARKGGVIAVNSNGLVAQYVAEIPEWEQALGVKIAALVGSAHYWCPVASPTLLGFSDDEVAHVSRTGSFIGSGVDKALYSRHSVAALSSTEDEDGEKVSPCTKCEFKANGTCPLWKARTAAASADVVVTNATVLGFSIGGFTPWARAIRRPVIVLDEADSCREPIAKVLGASITVKDEIAVDKASALEVVYAWASDDTHKKAEQARKFLARKRDAENEGRLVIASVNDNGAVELSIPVDLTDVFAPLNVVAMSATLSQRNVDDLGLKATVESFQGLDVSASTVTVQDDAPAWAWGKDGPPAAWTAHVAAELVDAFRNGGRTLGLFQSNADLDAVLATLPADVRKAVLVYSSKTDRTTVVKTYTAAPESHLLLGLVQGAGRGLNLPGELLRNVIVSRVPQNAPRGADREIWTEDSRASVTQSVGRAHRAAGDWGHVTIVGGFGRRNDVEKALTDLGWKIS